VEVSTITEVVATIFATFGIVFGMGATFWRGYQKGKCLLPRIIIWWVNVPMSIAVILRAVTFILNEDYWFFVVLDVAAFIILIGTICQHFGLLLKKKVDDSS